MVQNKLEEKDLVDLLQAQSKEGFEYLYSNYSEALYGIIFKLTNNQEVAEDLLQDVFIKIWQNIKAYNPSRGRLFTWILNLTKNLTIDKMRSANYKYHFKNLPFEIENQSSYEKNHNEIQNVDKIGLKEMVKSLREDYRIIIELYYFSGYTQNEISDYLQIPLGTVKTRMRAAINELQKNF